MGDGKKPDEGGKPDTGENKDEKKDEGSKGGKGEPDSKAELAAAQARIAELNKESAKHRKEAEAFKTKFESFEQAFQTALGTKKPEETIDAVKQQKAAAEQKSKTLLLKSAFVSVAAKEMHDAEFAFGSLQTHFKDVNVDLEAETVDKAALTTKLGEIKKLHPFLFVSASAGGGSGSGEKKPVTPAPDGNGQPGGGGNAYAQWQTLKQQNRIQEAQEFYNKNRAAILLQLP